MDDTDFEGFPMKSDSGRIILLERSQILYINVEGDDTLIRTARRKRYPQLEPVETIEGRLPSLPFFRIHRSYIVDLDRVDELRSRGTADHELKLDPPVNKVLPISRRRYDELKEVLGI